MGAKNKNKGGDRRPSGIGVSPQTKAQADYNKKTGFQTKGGGLLRDRFGNVVRSNVQVQRANQQKAIRDRIAQNIQAQEAKQVRPTEAGITSVMDRMEQDRQNLLARAKRNKITNQQLHQLGKLNTDLGFNRTTGMGPIESLRDQFTKPEFRQGIGNLIQNYQKISPIGILMRNILNPQFEEQTGIQSLPEFKGLQRSNMMFGPGVYDFTQSTRMPMNMAEATPEQRGILRGLLDRFINPSIMENQIEPGLEQQDKKRNIIEQMREETASMPMQFADASRSDINTVLSPMFRGMDRDMIEALGGTFSPEFTDQDFEDIREGIITSPTGIYSAQI